MKLAYQAFKVLYDYFQNNSTNNPKLLHVKIDKIILRCNGYLGNELPTAKAVGF